MKYLFFWSIIFAFSTPLKSSAQAPAVPADTIPLNQAAPDFSLKDISGKTVTLSLLKGKVVVLDFWATWCVPCHENFPAMQKVVNHYKADKNIVFLFIDTGERSDDYVSLAKADMERNHYNFHVIFDEKGTDGKQKKYRNIYGMWGIPTEFIIDAKGILHYKLVGYNSNLTNQQRADELIKQIELVKTSSKGY